MEHKLNYQAAMINGAILALITIGYTLIGQLIGNSSMFISIPLWILKFAGIVALLIYFIKQDAAKYEFYSYGAGFRTGLLISLFSTIVCAAFTVLYYTVISPDAIATTISSVEQALASNPDVLEQLEDVNMYSIMKTVMFIFMPIYYFIWGLILSAICASFTKKVDLFANSQPQQPEL